MLAKKRWITFAKPVVQGAAQVIEYLGRYVHKTAIGNRAVVATDERSVTFRYIDSRSHKRHVMTLPAFEFLRRFLQHVPPKGFHRVRCFGLLHSRHRKTLRTMDAADCLAWSSAQLDSEKPGLAVARAPPRHFAPHATRTA